MSRRAGAAFAQLHPAPQAAASAPAPVPAPDERRKYTVLLEHADARTWDALARSLDDELGRRVAKSEILRALIYMTVGDQALTQRLAAVVAKKNGMPS